MSDDHETKPGYGRPPVAHRFKKGRSGNPRGRPRKPKLERAYLTRQVRSDIIEIMEELVTVRTASGVRREPAVKVLLRGHLAKAYGGHAPSMRFMVRLYGQAIQEHEANLPKRFALAMLRDLEEKYGDAPPDPATQAQLNLLRKWTRET